MSDQASVQWHIAKLDEAQGTGSISTEEQRCILRVFYAFHLDSTRTHSSFSTAINARARTARLFGGSQCTISAIVTKWVEDYRTGADYGKYDFNSALISNKSCKTFTH